MEVLITPRPGPWPELNWVLFPTDGRAVGEGDGRQRLTWALMGLPGILRSVDDRAALLTRAAAVVRDAVDDDAAVSISLGSPLDPVAIGTTPGPASHVDGAQMAAGEGPGVDAFVGRTTVTSDDARADRRWPHLSRHLPEGVGPVVAVPMTANADTAGVLTILLPPGRTTAGALQVAGVFAVTVPALVAELGAKAALADLAGDLRRAMESRAVIEQAKGIIMAERHCDDEDAFAHLVRLSSTEHVKLRDLARTIVARASGAESAGA